jgi:type IV pilus assembly protein PilN
MRQINLLPWREARRKQRKRDFGILGVLTFVFSLLVVGVVHLYFSTAIEFQHARNNYLLAEIEEQKRVEAEINALEKAKAQILGRLEIIQNLQRSRPEMVHVLDEMVRVLPEEVFLTNLSRSGESLQVTGIARSNNLVSDFMRNLRDSEWFGEPVLLEINNESMLGVRASFFQLRVAKKKLTSTGEEEST